MYVPVLLFVRRESPNDPFAVPLLFPCLLRSLAEFLGKPSKRYEIHVQNSKR